MKKVLFVCTGNICRSPTAEAVFMDLVYQNRVESFLTAKSAGTHGYHIGEPPDQRAIEMARKSGIDMQSLVARKIAVADFQEYDLIFAMDRGHYAHLQKLCPQNAKSEIMLFGEFYDPAKGADVPDPYYGSEKDFQATYQMIKKGCLNIFEECKKRFYLG